MKRLIPAILMAIVGVVLTLVVTGAVVWFLLQTGDSESVSNNAAIIGALVALGGIFTAQIVGIVLESQRAREARNLEAERANEIALQNYLEQVGRLLIENPLPHGADPGTNQSTNQSIMIRAHSLAVLEGLDADRKRILLLFLYESGLIRSETPAVSLQGANLREANLSETNLRGAELSETNLKGADLRETNLNHANLEGSNLRGANLTGAFLFETNLRETNLSVANTRDATGFTNEGLEQQAVRIGGAIMPDGSKQRQWRRWVRWLRR